MCFRYKQYKVISESRNIALWWLKSLRLKRNSCSKIRGVHKCLVWNPAIVNMITWCRHHGRPHPHWRPHLLQQTQPVCLFSSCCISTGSQQELGNVLWVSSVVTCTWRRAGPPAGAPSAAGAPAGGGWRSTSHQCDNDGSAHCSSLTLSFLNSSYSGLSVGSSSLHSGQVLVCRWTHRRERGVSGVRGRRRAGRCGDVLTLLSQGRMQEEWKRCLQGIWWSFSCLWNFNRHTGHLTPLSETQTRHRVTLLSENIKGVTFRFPFVVHFLSDSTWIVSTFYCKVALVALVN